MLAHKKGAGAQHHPNLRRLMNEGAWMDLNVRAFRTVQAALSEPILPDKRKDSSRKGGLRGGPARAKSISPARRSAIARKASQERWRNRTEGAASGVPEGN